MAASTEQVARLRRMVNEPNAETYSDEDIAAYIERHPLIDELGAVPYFYLYQDGTNTQTVNTLWVPTYDLNAAAAEIWEEKAGVLSQDFDFSADGGSYSRSQAYEQAMGQARRYSAKRSIRTFTLRPAPEPELSNRA